MKYLELLLVIVVVCALCAWKAGRPVKLFLTQQEARYWRVYWWTCAKRELKAWLICFPLPYLILVAGCNGQDWGLGVHLAVVGISLLVFSRLCIWLVIVVLAYGFIGGSISHYVLGLDFPVWIFPQISVILALVIVFRRPFFVLFVWRWSAARPIAPRRSIDETGRVIDI
jgi:hypothetical protein